RDRTVTGVQTCALPISEERGKQHPLRHVRVQRAAAFQEARQPVRQAISLLRTDQRRRLSEGGDRHNAVLELRGGGDRPAASRGRSEERRVGKVGSGGW